MPARGSRRAIALASGRTAREEEPVPRQTAFWQALDEGRLPGARRSGHQRGLRPAGRGDALEGIEQRQRLLLAAIDLLAIRSRSGTRRGRCEIRRSRGERTVRATVRGQPVEPAAVWYGRWKPFESSFIMTWDNTAGISGRRSRGLRGLRARWAWTHSSDRARRTQHTVSIWLEHDGPPSTVGAGVDRSIDPAGLLRCQRRLDRSRRSRHGLHPDVRAERARRHRTRRGALHRYPDRPRRSQAGCPVDDPARMQLGEGGGETDADAQKRVTSIGRPTSGRGTRARILQAGIVTPSTRTRSSARTAHAASSSDRSEYSCCSAIAPPGTGRGRKEPARASFRSALLSCSIETNGGIPPDHVELKGRQERLQAGSRFRFRRVYFHGPSPRAATCGCESVTRMRPASGARTSKHESRSGPQSGSTAGARTGRRLPGARRRRPEPSPWATKCAGSVKLSAAGLVRTGTS